MRRGRGDRAARRRLHRRCRAARRRAVLRPRRRLRRSWRLLCAAWVALAARGVRVSARSPRAAWSRTSRSACEILARAGGLPFPAGVVDEPLLDDAGRAALRAPALRRSASTRRSRGGGDASCDAHARRHSRPARPGLTPSGGGGGRGGARAPAHRGRPRPRRRARRRPCPATRPLLAEASETEIDGLRSYREGTPASRIHWPAFAPPRPARASAAGRGRQPPAGPARRPRPARGAPRRGGTRGRVADAAAGRGGRLLAAAARRPPPHAARAGPGRLARRCTPGSRSCRPAARPGPERRGRRLGPVVYVAARPLAAAPRGLERVPRRLGPRGARARRRAGAGGVRGRGLPRL